MLTKSIFRWIHLLIDSENFVLIPLPPILNSNSLPVNITKSELITLRNRHVTRYSLSDFRFHSHNIITAHLFSLRNCCIIIGRNLEELNLWRHCSEFLNYPFAVSHLQCFASKLSLPRRRWRQWISSRKNRMDKGNESVCHVMATRHPSWFFFPFFSFESIFGLRRDVGQWIVCVCRANQSS